MFGSAFEHRIAEREIILASGMLESFSNGNPNPSFGERAIYVGLGLGLAAAGARPRPNPLLNVLALAPGSYLAWCGYQGRCPAKATLFDASRQTALRGWRD